MSFWNKKTASKSITTNKPGSKKTVTKTTTKTKPKNPFPIKGAAKTIKKRKQSRKQMIDDMFND